MSESPRLYKNNSICLKDLGARRDVADADAFGRQGALGHDVRVADEEHIALLHDAYERHLVRLDGVRLVDDVHLVHLVETLDAFRGLGLRSVQVDDVGPPHLDVVLEKVGLELKLKLRIHDALDLARARSVHLVDVLPPELLHALVARLGLAGRRRLQIKVERVDAVRVVKELLLVLRTRHLLHVALKLRELCLEIVDDTCELPD